MRQLALLLLCFLVSCGSTVQTPLPVRATTGPLIATIEPSATSFPTSTITPTSIVNVLSSFTPVASATAWTLSTGLSIEEHPLAQRPELEPLMLYPLDNLTQEQMFAKHADEFKNSLRPESYYGICYCTLWVMQGSDKLEASYGQPSVINLKTDVQVTRNGKVIFSEAIYSTGVTSDVRVLTTYNNHWVIELAERQELQINGQSQVYFSGSIFVDGRSINNLQGYDESFGFQTIHGRPFYFYKKDGKIGASYDGVEIPLKLNGIPHYGCCSAGEMNPRMAQNIVGFYAWRGDQWYYIEIGVFENS